MPLHTGRDIDVSCVHFFICGQICVQCLRFGLYPMPLHNRCKIDGPCIHLCICSSYNVHAVIKIWLE